MAELQGLTVSDFPFLRMKPVNMPWVLWGNLAWGWRDKPYLREPAQWPLAMQREWGDDRDQGRTAGAAHQQRQIRQFERLGKALDEFDPDLLVVFYRDVHETFAGEERPRFWIHSHDAVRCQMYNLWTFFRDNYFEENPDRVDTLSGHPEAAALLTRALTDAGIETRVVERSPHPNGLGHNAIATAVHLDWERQEYRRPILPIGIDPFRFDRVRSEEGLTPWDRDNPNPPLTPREAFDLGVEIARALRASPWRAALVAGADWSHANDSGLELERIHPDIDADERRFDQWRRGAFTDWGSDWSFEEMERHAQWELLIAIVLAGAMSETGAPVVYADFQPTWVCNDNFVTTLFEPR
ncbi:MAG: hypothetical protein VX663_03140 [Pseudomonadota bacterium]|nr:hypothetical protein [Pseudomonadota bacterium]